MIPHDAEERFHAYLESTEQYNAAIVAAGDEPWHQGDIERRRELFFRRWKQPELKSSLPVRHSLKEHTA